MEVEASEERPGRASSLPPAYIQRGKAHTMIGERIGKIRIVDHISRGGMGNVYVGVDEKLNRKVAIKTLRRKHRLEPRTKARLLREAQILSQLDHRHTCRIHDLVEWQGEQYLVLELSEGKSLKEAMQEKMSLA
jgi:serine/threonine-protein kinase